MKFIKYYRKIWGKQTPSMLRQEFDGVAHLFQPRKVAGFIALSRGLEVI